MEQTDRQRGNRTQPIEMGKSIRRVRGGNHRPWPACAPPAACPRRKRLRAVPTSFTDVPARGARRITLTASPEAQRPASVFGNQRL